MIEGLEGKKETRNPEAISIVMNVNCDLFPGYLKIVGFAHLSMCLGIIIFC